MSAERERLTAIERGEGIVGSFDHYRLLLVNVRWLEKWPKTDIIRSALCDYLMDTQFLSSNPEKDFINI